MINIAELLKDAPEGMKLYSPLFGEVEFAEVMDTDYVPIRVMKRGYGLRFDEYGRYMGNEYPDSECLLFPSKDCRTWEGWEAPIESKFKDGDWLVYKDGGTFCNGLKTIQVQTVEKDRYIFTHGTNSSHLFIDSECRLWTIQDVKDGDVLVTTKIRSCPFIYRKTSYNNNLAYYYAGIDGNGDFCEGCLKRTLSHFGSIENVVPATKEQRDLLFAKMKEAGYQWDAKKKELKKIQFHYDIANFKPFDKVLVRDCNHNVWRCSWFSHYNDKEVGYPFVTACSTYKQCIPYEGNEHLLGTTDMCDEQYINW